MIFSRHRESAPSQGSGETGAPQASAAPPAGPTIDQVRARLDGGTATPWDNLLLAWVAELGEPHLVQGPDLSLRWYLADGAAELRPTGAAWLTPWDVHARREESSRWAVLTPAAPPSCELPGRVGTAATTFAEVRSELLATLRGLSEDLQRLPPVWDQHLVVEWYGARGRRHVRINASASRVVVTEDRRRLHLAPTTDESVAAAVELLVTRLRVDADGHDERAYLTSCERAGWFTYGEQTAVHPG